MTSAALALGIVGLTAAPANALPSDVSVAEGQLLSGSGTIDTDTVAELAPAYSATPSGAATDNHPLDLDALSGVAGLDLGSGIGLLNGANPVLQLGVDGQYAATNPDGSAYAASGALNNDGSIDAGAGTDPTADTTLNLTPLLAQAGVSDSLISALEVRLGAVSASASGDGGQTTGDYQIAGGHIIITAPAVTTADQTLTTTLSGVTDTLNTALGNAGLVNSITGPLTTALNTLGLGVVSISGTTVDASLTTADLSNVLASAGTASSADGGVTISLANGTVDLDLSALLGGSLDNLPANTDLLASPTLQNALSEDLTEAVSNLVQQVTTAAQAELYSETVNVQIATNLTVLGLPIGDVDITISGPLGGFLGASGYAAPTSTATTSVIGLDLSDLTNALTSGVVPAVTSAVGAVINPLIPTVLSQPIAAVGDTLGTALQGLSPALDTVVKLTANVQETPGTFTTDGAGPADFTERALQVQLVPAAGPLATVNLASATVRSTSQLTLTPDAGPSDGGQTVTISGSSAIDNATTVDFGDTTYYLAGSAGASDNPDAPTFTQDSDTGDIHLVTQATPAGAVDVTVTSPSGTSAPATYTFYDAPSNLVLDPTQGPSAGGQSVTISGDGLDGATSVDFGGTTFYLAGSDDAAANPDAPTFTQDSDTGDITLTTPAHAAGQIDVTVTNPGGTSPAVAYTYYDVPSNLVLDPNQGPVAGGQSVTISGDGLDGATAVDFGGTTFYLDGSTAASQNPGAPTFAQAPNGDITLSTPAHGVGTVDVTVTNPAGTSDPVTYTYVAAPGNLALSPDVGPLAGGQTVTISGDNLGTASSVDFGGTTFYLAGSDEASANPGAPTFTQDSGTGDITLVTPAGTDAGAVDVTVTTAGGTTDPATYTYVNGPAITGVSPAAGPVAGGQSVTISGDGLDEASSVDFGGTTYYPEGDPDVPADAPTFTQDPDTGDITLSTPPADDAGPVDVTVTTPAGTTPPYQYTYVAAPVAGAIDPNAGPLNGGQTVTISGTDLDGATSVDFGGTTVYLAGSPDAAAHPDAPTFTQDPDTGDITLTTPAGTTAGPVQVTVSTAGGTTDPLTYTYASVPAITGVTPNEGPIGGDQPITISGNDLCGATQVDFGGTTYYLAGSDEAASHATAPTFTQDPDTCAISLTTPPGTSGPVDVTVTTPGGESAPAQYTYVNAPANLELSPNVGPVAGGQTVTITGDDLDTATVVDFGGTDVYLAGSDEADAHQGAPIFTYDASADAITLTTPAHAAGQVDVTVTNPGGTSNALAYTYVAVPGAVTVSPDHGPQSGGTEVTLSGDDLDNATTVTVGGVTYYPAGSDAASDHPDAPTFTQDPTSGDITLTTQPTTTTGPADVTVTTAGGTSPASTFTFDPSPVIASISPAAGPTAGGQTVTISGDNLDGATSVSFGGTTLYPAGSAAAAAHPNNGTFTQNATTGDITLKTPAHAVGTVKVTVTTPNGTSNAINYKYGVITPGTPTITGSAAVGGTLVANPGTWNPSDVDLTYTWTLPDGTVLGHGQTLVVPNSAAGKTITLTVKGTKSGYTSASATATKKIAAYTGPKTIRLQGPQRYDTAIAISQDSFPVKGSADVVYIAQSENFPDALSAGPAAVKQNGPLLLTPHNQLLPQVATEIKRLSPAKIVIVGGTGAITPSVATALEKLAPTVREGGKDRYETSLLLAKYAFGSSLNGVFVATGTTFPDALSAAAFAGSHNEPVLLVKGTDSTAPSAVLSYLKSAKPTTVSVAGGTGAVTTGILQSLKTATGVSPKRFGGSDRYETSQLINAQFKTAPDAYLATGLNFPDALTGATAAGRIAAPLYVIPQSCLPKAVTTAFAKWQTGTVKILGGPGALTKPSVDNLQVCK